MKTVEQILAEIDRRMSLNTLPIEFITLESLKIFCLSEEACDHDWKDRIITKPHVCIKCGETK